MAFPYNPDAFNFVPMQDTRSKPQAEAKKRAIQNRAIEELKNYRTEKRLKAKKQLIRPQANSLAEVALATMAVILM